MSKEFRFDVFLSHSSKDKEVVRRLAESLRTDELEVWFDEWEIKPGDNIPAKIEEGLEHSRILVLCMSANAFGSDWATLEANTFRFRDPINKERRFIPLRLDDAPIKGSLAQFLYINWLPPKREQEYQKLLESCKLPQEFTFNSNPLTVDSSSKSPASNQTPIQSMALVDANIGIAISQTLSYKPGQRPTVWVIGSYSELDLRQTTLTRKLIVTLGSSLAARGVRLVSGKSDMLDELAAHCRNIAMSLNPRGPLPVILDGKLRQTDLRRLFIDTINRIPDLAIVIGGGISRGRVAEECVAAREAGIPLLPVPPTGGAAAESSLTAFQARDLYDAMAKETNAADVNDLVAALLLAVERYSPGTLNNQKPSHSMQVVDATKNCPFVMSVHGIRTHASWQKTLGETLSGGGISHFESIDYGYYGINKFLLHWRNNAMVEAFVNEYHRIVREQRFQLHQYCKSVYMLKGDSLLQILRGSFTFLIFALGVSVCITRQLNMISLKGGYFSLSGFRASCAGVGFILLSLYNLSSFIPQGKFATLLRIVTIIGIAASFVVGWRQLSKKRDYSRL